MRIAQLYPAFVTRCTLPKGSVFPAASSCEKTTKLTGAGKCRDTSFGSYYALGKRGRKQFRRAVPMKEGSSPNIHRHVKPSSERGSRGKQQPPSIYRWTVTNPQRGFSHPTLRTAGRGDFEGAEFLLGSLMSREAPTGAKVRARRDPIPS